MLKRLRRRFVFVAMSLVTVILFLVFATIITINIRSNLRLIEQQLEQALDLAELMPMETPPEMPDFPLPGERLPEPRMNALTFSVTLDASGELIRIQRLNVNVADETIDALVDTVSQKEADAGTLFTDSVRYARRVSSDVTHIAFADVGHLITSVSSLFWAALVIGGLGWLAFFCISLLLSRQILRPVERAWQQQKQFIADASHELKTPLTIILANLDLLMAHRRDDPQKLLPWIQSAQEESVRMKSLVEDMLFLARADAESQPTVFSPLSLSDLATQASLSFEPVAFEAGVTLNTEILPDVQTEGSTQDLHRLLVILLDNAVKYAGVGGTVDLVLTQHGANSVLQVKNTGTPIPEEMIPRIFDRFYRADQSRSRESGGYGLGLAIAKEIAAAHGARLELSESSETQTVFQVTFDKNHHSHL